MTPPPAAVGSLPLRYRGYYYDSETGFYYLQSRYYDPVTHRFINADSLASTGQGFTGTNMFAYCNNDPINRTDTQGTISIDVAAEFLNTWLWGDGSDVIYENDTEVAKVFADSPTTKREIQLSYEKYLAGEAYETGRIYYDSGETDLWLAVRHANYTITIDEKVTTYSSVSKKTIKRTRYTITMVIFDGYNFNKGNETGDGIGSVLNNIAYYAHAVGIGTNYDWEVILTKVIDKTEIYTSIMEIA